MKKFLQIACLMLLPLSFTYGQTGSINLKNGYIVEHGGTSAKPVYLVLAYGQPAALTYTNGFIVSEGEFNNVRWYINNGIGTYTVPFGSSGTYNPANGLPTYASVGSIIPVILNITGAGTGSGGSGFIDFSTYHTLPLNSSNLPVGYAGDPTNLAPIYPLLSQPNTTDNSWNLIDRFWFINAQSYSPKPTLGNVQLSYLKATNSEIAAPNVFTETQLLAQRFNPAKGWGDWLGGGGLDFGTGFGGSGTVSASDFFRVWTLSNQNSPLPIKISSFTTQCDNNVALVQWTSQSELNNDYYTIKKTMDNVHFETVGTVKGAGTSSLANNYSMNDNSPFGGTSYYYLYQTDFDGNVSEVGAIPFNGCAAPSSTAINSYNTINFIEIQINSVGVDNFDISLVNLLGQSVIHENHSVVLGNNEVRLNNNLSPGIYLLNVKNAKYNYTKKLVIGVK